MYTKLILRNARRSVRDYLIYIVTLTVCVALFYAFSSIASRYYHPDIGAEYDLTRVRAMLEQPMCLLSLLVLFLIAQVNQYMLRHRQKEFAVQTLLGMEQKTTAWLFFSETMLMGVLSVGIGIPLGVAGAQFATAMLMEEFGLGFRLEWMLFPDTAVLTAGVFVIIFLLIGLQNMHLIRKWKVIDMLHAEKKGDGDYKKSFWMPGVLLVYGVMLVIMLGSGVTNLMYYFDRRFAVPVHILYMGNVIVPALGLAAYLVWIVRKPHKTENLVLPLLGFSLAGAGLACLVPSMKVEYFLPLHAGITNKYLVFLVVDMCFAVCAFFYLVSGFLTKWRNHSLQYKYHKENLFFYGQVIAKLKSTTKTMSVICITLILSVCLFIITPVLINWAEGYQATIAIYDVQISSGYLQTRDEAEIPQDDYGLVDAYFRENDLKTAYDCTFSRYLPEKEDFHNRKKTEFPGAVISLSDYNMLRKMRGYEPVFLKENEFMTHWDSIADEEEKQTFRKNHPKIETDGGELVLAENGIQDAVLGQTITNRYTNMAYICPDAVCEKLLFVGTNRYIKTASPLTFQEANELETRFREKYPEEGEGMNYAIRTSTVQLNDKVAGKFMVKACLTYGALVLMIMGFTLLALQQLSDAPGYRKRFCILRQLGVDESSQNRLLFRQIAFWFGFPVLVAVLVSAVVSVYFFHMLSDVIAAYIGEGVLFTQILTITVILLLLFACYFISTWILFRKSVEEIS